MWLEYIMIKQDSTIQKRFYLIFYLENLVCYSIEKAFWILTPPFQLFLFRAAEGEWTFADLDKNFWLVDSKDMNMLYAGYAIKK